MPEDRSAEHALDGADLQSIHNTTDETERRRAASRLLARHQERVYLWVFRYVQDHERALELTQDVLLKAYQGLPTYLHRARFSSWLFMIVRNCCLSELRRPALTRVLELEPDQLPADTEGPAQGLAEKELWRLIDGGLESMESDALRLRCIEGLSVDAITEVLQVSGASGARGVLQRARRKLRKLLDGEVRI